MVAVAKQQLQSACEAAQRDKEAAVSRSMQSVQRRASKEALHQVLVHLIYCPPLLTLHLCCHRLIQSASYVYVLVSCPVNTTHQSRIWMD